MKRSVTRRQFNISAALAGFPAILRAAPAARPSIVVILADDQGYGDFTCYNPKSIIPTPHTDRAARAGMMFTDAHSGSAVCSYAIRVADGPLRLEVMAQVPRAAAVRPAADRSGPAHAARHAA